MKISGPSNPISATTYKRGDAVYNSKAELLDHMDLKSLDEAAKDPNSHISITETQLRQQTAGEALKKSARDGLGLAAISSPLLGIFGTVLTGAFDGPAMIGGLVGLGLGVALGATVTAVGFRQEHKPPGAPSTTEGFVFFNPETGRAAFTGELGDPGETTPWTDFGPGTRQASL